VSMLRVKGSTYSVPTPMAVMGEADNAHRERPGHRQRLPRRSVLRKPLRARTYRGHRLAHNLGQRWIQKLPVGFSERCEFPPSISA
jgi:hypothetical protein